MSKIVIKGKWGRYCLSQGFLYTLGWALKSGSSNFLSLYNPRETARFISSPAFSMFSLTQEKCLIHHWHYSKASIHSCEVQWYSETWNEESLRGAACTPVEYKWVKSWRRPCQLLRSFLSMHGNLEENWKIAWSSSNCWINMWIQVLYQKWLWNTLHRFSGSFPYLQGDWLALPCQRGCTVTKPEDFCLFYDLLPYWPD